MSGRIPFGQGIQSPTTPTFQTSLFIPTRAVYQPEPGQPDPDELIRDIPFPAAAFSAFQSVTSSQVKYIGNQSSEGKLNDNQTPMRDVPSNLITHISIPQTSGPEPDWVAVMNHFKTKRCLDGIGNLQDL
jgi:hypothetical protein